MSDNDTPQAERHTQSVPLVTILGNGEVIMNGLTPENALRMAQLCAGVQQRLLQLAQAETTETPESDT